MIYLYLFLGIVGWMVWVLTNERPTIPSSSCPHGFIDWAECPDCGH